MIKRIIIQSPLAKDGVVLKVDEKASLEDIKRAALAALPQHQLTSDLELFDEADDDVETRQFADSEELRHGHIIHIGRCKLVDVVVRYAGRRVDRRFIAATRVGRVRRWAVKELGISSSDANELVLQVAGTSIQPGRDQHVGSYVEHGSCTTTFDLVRSYTVNGDVTLTSEHAVLEAHLEGAPFLVGQMNGRWRLRAVAWPHVLFDVFARDGRPYALRLDCSGYPQMPTGSFWAVEQGTWLPAARWPRAGARFGAALRTDWQGGTALYIPCDRRSIAGHEQWVQLHPAWVWDPRIGVARYLEVVWTLLNGDDYVAPAA